MEPKLWLDLAADLQSAACQVAKACVPQKTLSSQTSSGGPFKLGKVCSGLHPHIPFSLHVATDSKLKTSQSVRSAPVPAQPSSGLLCCVPPHPDMVWKVGRAFRCSQLLQR